MSVILKGQRDLIKPCTRRCPGIFNTWPLSSWPLSFPSDEVLGWHIVNVGEGDRFAALEPIKQGLRKIRGAVGKDIGQGIAIRHDWGPQYIAHDFKTELKFFGLKNSPAFVHEPQTNGVIERFFKTIKMECIWLEYFQDVEHARGVVGRWMELYNTQWLIERHGHQTPREVREAQQIMSAVAWQHKSFV